MSGSDEDGLDNDLEALEGRDGAEGAEGTDDAEDAEDAAGRDKGERRAEEGGGDNDDVKDVPPLEPEPHKPVVPLEPDFDHKDHEKDRVERREEPVKPLLRTPICLDPNQHRVGHNDEQNPQPERHALHQLSHQIVRDIRVPRLPSIDIHHVSKVHLPRRLVLPSRTPHTTRTALSVSMEQRSVPSTPVRIVPLLEPRLDCHFPPQPSQAARPKQRARHGGRGGESDLSSLRLWGDHGGVGRVAQRVWKA